MRHSRKSVAPRAQIGGGGGGDSFCPSKYLEIIFADSRHLPKTNVDVVVRAIADFFMLSRFSKIIGFR